MSQPWTETIRFSEVARGPVRRKLEADEATRKAVARHLDLISIESLTADLKIAPWLDGIQIDGRFKSDVTQTCSVTAEPLPAGVDGEFMVRVVPAGSPNAPQEETGEEIDLDPEADDPPDVNEGDLIDLGNYVIEHLSLELDPFPRKPGAVFEAPADTEERSPFAVLRALKTEDDAKK